jgi:hypothetical protein
MGVPNQWEGNFVHNERFRASIMVWDIRSSGTLRTGMLVIIDRRFGTIHLSHSGDRQAVPKRRSITTTTRCCVTSQKSEDLNCAAAEAWNDTINAAVTLPWQQTQRNSQRPESDQRHSKRACRNRRASHFVSSRSVDDSHGRSKIWN